MVVDGSSFFSAEQRDIKDPLQPSGFFIFLQMVDEFPFGDQWINSYSNMYMGVMVAGWNCQAVGLEDRWCERRGSKKEEKVEADDEKGRRKKRNISVSYLLSQVSFLGSQKGN